MCGYLLLSSSVPFTIFMVPYPYSHSRSFYLGFRFSYRFLPHPCLMPPAMFRCVVSSKPCADVVQMLQRIAHKYNASLLDAQQVGGTPHAGARAHT